LSASDEKAAKFFAPHKLEEVPRVADPEGKLYEEFGLVRAHWRQYVNKESILRMLIAWLNGHWAGLLAGDPERMPGVFLLVGGRVQKAFRHKLVSDRPDYLEMATLSTQK
jgi:hypothetical protein